MNPLDRPTYPGQLWVNVFYCETCDKDFDSLDELMEHTSAKKHTGTGLYR